MIERDAIRNLGLNELIVVRGTIDSRTFEWATTVEKFEWVPRAEPWTVALRLRILGSEFNDGIDARLTHQKDAINRLQAHLDHHCSGLAALGCDMLRRDQSA